MFETAPSTASRGKALESPFARLGRAVARHPGRTVGLCAVLLALALAAILTGAPLSSGTIAGTEAARAEALATGATAAATSSQVAAIFHSSEWRNDDPRFRDALARTVAEVRRLPEVAEVIAPLGELPRAEERLLARSGHDVLVLVRLKGDEKAAVRAYPTVRAALGTGPLEVLATGKPAYLSTLNRLLERDLLTAELISLPLALLVLLRVFRTFVAALLPVVVGGLAVLTGVGGVLALAHVLDLAQYTVNLVSLIGLGVAIDYSLFIVSRFRDELSAGRPVEDAIARTLDTSGRAVAFSGIAVGVGLSGLLFYRRSYLSAMGLGGAIVVVCAVLYALTLLPALLAWLGPRIERGRVPFARPAGTTGGWHRLATWVMRHPWKVLLPTLAVLVAIGAPFRHLQVAASDVSVLPPKEEPRRAAAELARLFPAEASTQLLVAVEFPSGEAFTEERVPALYAASRRFAALPGVTSVQSIVDLDPSVTESMYGLLAGHPSLRPSEFAQALAAFTSGRVAVFLVGTAAAPTSPEARALVRTLREQRQVGDGTLLVGGQTAGDVDTAAFISAHSKKAIVFVMSLTAVVLFVLLGSVLLPLKALLMNLLSIAGSFGALVFVFQEGHLSGLLRFEPGPIEPSLPILLFCILFGLSMDYEVLLLSRIREEWLRTKDNTLAVAEGLERTGGLITSAAMIMVAVFAAFSLAQAVVVKATGVAMALAVALDATLVRVLIVPAMMRLLGTLNWWAPRPLAALFGWFHRPHRLRERSP